jgi:hypothetical protein
MRVCQRSAASFILMALLAGTDVLASQRPDVAFTKHPISPECGSDVCEEAAMVVAALVGLLEWDTDLARFQGSPVLARILRTLHADPDNAQCLAGPDVASPASSTLNRDVQSFAERRGKPVTIVTCTEVRAPPGSADLLTRGAPLVVFSPLDWTGPDDARLRAAVFLAPGWHGANYFVYLHRGTSGWTTARVGPGGAR